jgi:hypothetical protein
MELITRVSANNQSSIGVANAFTGYLYYKVMLEQLVPQNNGAHLQALYYVNENLANGNNYSAVGVSNDSGGNNFYSYGQDNLAIWAPSRSGPQNGGGVSGELLFYNPEDTATYGFIGKVYSSQAFNNLPCIIELVGTCTNPPSGGITGIVFNFDSGNITSGSLAIYGCN